MADRKNNFSKKRPKKNFNNSTHSFRKRPSQKFQQAENIIYVSNKTHIKAYLQKCSDLINNKNFEEIIIYCLGAAIPKGILIALQVCEKHLSYKLSTNTLTTELYDDFEPLVDDADFESQQRYNSALQIKIKKEDFLKPSE